jgi:transcriptional regulator with GAF, ATPase, and Fis domain
MESMQAWCVAPCDAAAFPYESLIAGLRREGIEVRPQANGADGSPGIFAFAAVTPQVCDSLRTISACGFHLVAAVGARSDLLSAEAWRLLHAGASDVLVWDPSTGAAQLAARLRHWQSVEQISHSPLVRDLLVGGSPVWKRVLRQVVGIAQGRSPVLILGETGTGKELAAQVIHTLDARPAKGALHVLDCTTIVPELAGSELFGHERGAFTHAVSARDGAFALANGGTLFLDEVGELPLPLQAQLLRVLQEGVYKRLGGNTWHRSEFRLICATHRDLRLLVQRGEFRQDLYYRIASATIRLPPLRDHIEDTLPLIFHFFQKLRPGETPYELDPMVRDFFLQRDYPGNVRELRQLVSRVLDRHAGPGPITIGDLPEEDWPPVDSPEFDWRDGSFDRIIRRALALGIPLKAIGRAVEERAVEIAVSEEDGNLQRAARRLGVTDRALQLRRAMGRGSSGGKTAMAG